MYVRRLTSFVCLGALVCWAQPATGEILRLGTWDGALEFGVDHANIETKKDGNNVDLVELENTRTEQRLKIRNSEAYLLDPRLFTFSLGGTFGLGQEEYMSRVRGVGATEQLDADLSGYEFLANILKRNSTLSAELFANRNRYILIRELAGNMDNEVESRGATLRAMRLYIPSSLSVRRDNVVSMSRIANSVVQTDEQRDVIRYEGLRGWVNKQMALRYELVDKTDSFRPALDYRSRSANLSTSIDFGTDLNRHLQSWLRVNSRDGFSSEERVQFSHLLQIDHRPNLKSTLRYHQDKVERSGGKTRSQEAAFSLNHQLYESLSTELGLNARDQSFADGRLHRYGGDLRFRYTKKLPGSGRLNASYMTTRQMEDDDFAEAFVPQEELTFDAVFATPMFLANANVIEVSVEVTKTANGPPVPGCAEFSTPNLLVEGVDYQLRTVGDRTEIVPQLCSATSPGINPGDTIAVDYRFTRGGDPVGFTTSLHRAHLSVDYGWIRPFFDIDRTDQDIESGMDSGFLTDRRTSSVGVELKGNWQRLQANLLVAAEDYESDDQVFDQDRVSAQVRYTLTPRIWLALNGQTSSTTYSIPEPRESDLILLRAELTYGRNGTFFGSVFARKQELVDTRVIDQSTNEYGVKARWRLGKLDVNGTISFLDVQRGISNSTDYRMMLNVRRRYSWR